MFEEPETVAKWTDECYWVNNTFNLASFLGYKFSPTLPYCGWGLKHWDFDNWGFDKIGGPFKCHVTQCQ